MTDATNNVSTVAKTQADMLVLTELPRTLMGGTRAMRKAAEKYLPKEPGEDDDAYQSRLSRTTLFNAFAKTVEDLTGKVFDKPIALKDDVPEQIKDYAEDIDLTGRHLNVFARDAFFDGMQTGGGYILVDMPQGVQREDGRPATLADEQAAKLRPYLVYIPVERLIGWKAETVGGRQTLTQVRIRETITVADGLYGEKSVDQIRVIEPGKWEIHQKNNKGEWVQTSSGVTKLRKITLVPFYVKRTGFMTFAPPLEKLAELNVAHWQSQSDQRNILHVARVPILFAAGWQNDDQLTISAGNMVRHSDPNAKLTFVEHAGAAIAAGDKDLENIERQMQAMGLQLLIDGPGGQSATGEIRDDAKENSPLAMMARSLGDALEQALGYMGEWIGLGEDQGGEVEVNTDFGISGNIGDIQYLTQAVLGGKLDDQTYIEELKRRGTLGESVDVDAVLDRIATQKPELDGPPMNLDEGAPPRDVSGDKSGAVNG